MTSQEILNALRNQGIEVDVRKGGESLEVCDNDGLLGSFRPGDALLIVVVVPEAQEKDVLAVHRHQRSDGSHKFRLLDGMPNGGVFHYGYVVPVEGRPPKGHTMWPENQIHLIIFGVKGSFEIVQISLVSQQNRIYLRAQSLYKGRVETTGDMLIVPKEILVITDPRFEAWKELTGLLSSHLSREVVFTPIRIAPTRYFGLTEDQAIVDFYNDAMGIGWAIINVGDELVKAKIHWSSIIMPGFHYLEDGSRVSFESVVETPHRSGPSQGQPRHELKGVRPIV